MCFSPTEDDVRRYLRLRAVCRRLNHSMLESIPRQAMEEIADALGILRHGVLIFDSEHLTSVLADCCLYDWVRDGKNLVQRYAETHPAPAGTDERYVLDACLQARYRILRLESQVAGAGAHCFDVLADDSISDRPAFTFGTTEFPPSFLLLAACPHSVPPSPGLTLVCGRRVPGSRPPGASENQK